MPSSTLLRTAITASSMMALPAVLAVISRPSRIGTPEAVRVPRVRQKRATAILRSSMPMTGILSISAVEDPPAVRRLVPAVDREAAGDDRR